MTKDMTLGNPGKILFLFALPILFGNIFQQLYSMVDSIVVGNFVGSDALAAVGGSYAITFAITGIAFGPQAGFLTGAIAAFASNFFFGQGPWTPWQMFAYGFTGFWAGLVFHGHPSWRKPWVLGLFGFFSILLLVGPMLDSCTVFTVLPKLSLANVLLIYGQGVPVNTIHGLGCGLTLLVLTKPLLQKLSRIQRKYGILEDRQ